MKERGVEPYKQSLGGIFRFVPKTGNNLPSKKVRLSTSLIFKEKNTTDVVDFSGATSVYNSLADEYVDYANNQINGGIFGYKDSDFQYSDVTTMEILEGALQAILSRTGKRTINILDYGAGNAIWPVRLALKHLHQVEILVHAIDPADGFEKKVDEVFRIAAQEYRSLEVYEKLKHTFKFSTGDETTLRGFTDGFFDLTLCLYTPLNHVKPNHLQRVVAELLRVSRYLNISSVRSKGGLPTVYSCALDDVERFSQEGNFMTFRHKNGRNYRLESFLFDRQQLINLFSPYGEIKDMVGLDFVLSRFRDREGWPALNDGQKSFLTSFEVTNCRHPEWINLANHILLLVEPRY